MSIIRGLLLSLAAAAAFSLTPTALLGQDSSRIAFFSDATGNYEIYVMNADGSVSGLERGFVGQAHRHDLLKMMLDRVYVDMTEATVVGVQPKPPFLPLFNLKEPVRSGEAL